MHKCSHSGKSVVISSALATVHKNYMAATTAGVFVCKLLTILAAPVFSLLNTLPHSDP